MTFTFIPSQKTNFSSSKYILINLKLQIVDRTKILETVTAGPLPLTRTTFLTYDTEPRETLLTTLTQPFNYGSL